MITEQMIEDARAGKTVYFLNEEGECMMLWIRGSTLAISPAREGDCQ